MKRWTFLLAFGAAVAVVGYVVVAQQPRGEGRKPDDPPAQRDRSARERPEGRAAHQAPAKRGVVAEFHTNPDGATDGLRLDDGTEVRFPPRQAKR